MKNLIITSAILISFVPSFAAFAMTPAEFNTITNSSSLSYTVCQLHGVIGATYNATNGTLESFTYTLDNCKVAKNYTDYIRLSWLETGRQLIEKGYTAGQWTGDAAKAITMWASGER